MFFVSKEIRAIVRNLEKSARDILMILQNIHNENNMEENISMCIQVSEIIKVPMQLFFFFSLSVVSQYCATSRELFIDVRKNYAKLTEVVPQDQYYRFHEQWRFVTQKLCFLASLIIYLEIKVLVTKETVAEILGGT